MFGIDNLNINFFPQIIDNETVVYFDLQIVSFCSYFK